MTVRRGRSTLGCLVALLFVTALLYFGVNVGEVYVRYYRYVDAMRQEARFAARRADDEIARRLAATADSLGLPEAAGKVTVRRDDGVVRISAEYYDHVELPLMVREIHFVPIAEAPL